MNRLVKFMVAAIAVVCLAVGCKDPQEESKQTVITLGSNALTVAANGGKYAIDYSLENPVAGATLTATAPTEEWMSDITVEEEKLTFTVEDNRTLGATSRQSSFWLEYNGAVYTEIVVTQESLSGEFTIEVLKVSPETVDVKITATNETLTYLCNFAPVEFIEQQGGIDNYALIDAEAYRTNAFYGDILDSYLGAGSTIKTFSFANPPIVPMYVYIAGMVRAEDQDRTPVLVTEPVVAEFTFLPYPTFTIESEGAEQFSVEAGSHTIPYTLTNPIEGESVTVKVLGGADNWVQNVVVDAEAQTISFDYTANDLAIERLGTLQFDYPYTDPLLYNISQAANVESENVTFDITIKEMHYNSIVVDCTTSDNNTKYVIGAIAKCDFESYTYGSNPAKIPEMDLSASIRTFVVTSGAATDVVLTNVAYQLDDEWYVYAYAVDDSEKMATSEVEMVAVTVPDDSPSFVWSDELVKDNTLTVDKQGGTFTIKYSVENPTPAGVVTIEESYDDILKKNNGKRVTHDAEAQTITFTVTQNTDGYKRSTYVYLKYFSSADDTTSDANISLKISQNK